MEQEEIKYGYTQVSDGDFGGEIGNDEKLYGKFMALFDEFKHGSEWIRGKWALKGAACTGIIQRLFLPPALGEIVHFCTDFCGFSLLQLQYRRQGNPFWMAFEYTGTIGTVSASGFLV